MSLDWGLEASDKLAWRDRESPSRQLFSQVDHENSCRLSQSFKAELPITRRLEKKFQSGPQHRLFIAPVGARAFFQTLLKNSVDRGSTVSTDEAGILPICYPARPYVDP